MSGLRHALARGGMLQKYATLRAAAASAILAALLLPGCGPDGLFAQGNSTSVTTHDNGAAKVSIRRPGYALRMETDGRATFRPDESDVEALMKGGELELSERVEGVRHLYTVRERDGGLVRSYTREGAPAPFEAAAQGWLAEALQRMFRETSFDAQARCARLLERGGSELVLREFEQTTNESARWPRWSRWTTHRTGPRAR